MTDGDREILNHFVITRSKTIELVQRLPADWLGRQAEGEHHPLGWVLLHIASGSNWWLCYCMKDGQSENWPPGDRHDSASILRALEQSRQRLLDFFEDGDGARMGQTFTLNPRELPDPGDGPLEAYTGRNRVLYLTDHEVHHRGKVVLALRQWGMRDVPFMPF